MKWLIQLFKNKIVYLVTTHIGKQNKLEFETRVRRYRL